MERDLQEDAKVAIDGGGGGHTPSQEKCGQNCQPPRFINKLASSDALRHYLSRGLQNSFLGSYLAQILRVSWKKAFFFKELGQLLSKFVALFFSLAAAITIILNFTSYAVANVCRYAKSLRIIPLQAFFLFSSLKKVLCNCLICRTFRIFRDSLASLFGRSAPWKGERLQRPHSGAILMLLALFIPIILGGIRYSEHLFEYRQEVLDTPTHSIYYKKCAKEAALAVAKAWNPGKTLSAQERAVYTAAVNAYNAARTYEEKISTLSTAIPGFVGKKSGTTIVDPSKKQTSYPAPAGKDYVKISLDPYGTNPDLGKITVQTDDDIASAIPAQCNLDVILAVPVNSDADVTGIKNKAKEFVNNFSCTRGVYFGLIPYSGKLSLPQTYATAWTVAFPTFQKNDKLLWIMRACLYATKGTAPNSLLTGYDWNAPYPIMFRKGTEYKEEMFGNNPYYSCSFLNSEVPNNDSNRYFRMNLNPCRETALDVTATTCTCETTCTTFAANPYNMVYPTDDLGLIYDQCNGLAPINNDSFNKSNFIFAALEWANNFLAFWDTSSSGAKNAVIGAGADATLGRAAASNNKKAVVLIVNKPDHFEPNEMTYLGFSDDCCTAGINGSEILDFTHNFGTSSIESPKGGLKFSGSAAYSGGCYQCNGATSCTLTCAYKRLVIITVDPIGEEGTVQFTNVTNESDSYGHKVKKGETYKVVARREFFIEPDMLPESLGLTFTATKLKLVSAKITTNSWRTTSASARYESGNKQIKLNCKRGVNVKVTSTQPTSNFVCKAKYDSGEEVELVRANYYENKDYKYEFSEAQLTKNGVRAQEFVFEGENYDIQRDPATFTNQLVLTTYHSYNGICSPCSGFSFGNEITNCYVIFSTKGGTGYLGKKDDVWQKLCDESTDGKINFDKLTKISDFSTTKSYTFYNYNSRQEFLLYSYSEAIIYVEVYASGTKGFSRNSSNISDILVYTGVSGHIWPVGSPTATFSQTDFLSVPVYPIKLTVTPTVDVSPESQYVAYKDINGTEHKQQVAPGNSWEKRFTPSNTQYTEDGGQYNIYFDVTFSNSYNINFDDNLYIYEEVLDNNIPGTCSVSINGNTATIFTSSKRKLSFDATPITGYIIFNHGSKNEIEEAKSQDFSFEGQNNAIPYEAKNTKVTKVTGASSIVGTYQLTNNDKTTQTFTLTSENPYGLIFYLNNDNTKVKIGYTRKILGISKDEWQTLENKSSLRFLSDHEYYKKWVSGTALSFITKKEKGDVADVTVKTLVDLTASVTDSYIPAGSDLEVTVENIGSSSSYIEYKKADGSGNAIETAEKEKYWFFGDWYYDRTITLDPTTCYYEPYANGYKIHLTLHDVKNIYDVQFAGDTIDEDPGNVVIRDYAHTEDVNQGVKVMTKDVCAKLKANYGNNYRLYLVKYKTKDSDDFSYFGDCVYATKTAKDEAGLKTALDEIEADLKPWGGHQEASVVAN